MSDYILQSYTSVLHAIQSESDYTFFPSTYLTLGKSDNSEKVFGSLCCGKDKNSYCRVFLYMTPFMRAIVVEATQDMIPSIVYGGDFIETSNKLNHRSFVKPIIPLNNSYE